MFAYFNCLVPIGDAMTEIAMPSRIKVLWFFLCCGAVSTDVAAESEIFNPREFSVPYLVDLGFVYSQIRLYVSVEFLLVCHGVFVGFIFCNFGILLWRSDEDLAVRRPARLGDHPRPKYIQRSWILIFLDERLKGFFETFEGSQVRAEIAVTMLLLQSGCNLYIEASAEFHVAKYEITKKMCLRDFIVILNYRSYFIVSKVYDTKHCVNV